jgi:hypothetical protein
MIIETDWYKLERDIALLCVRLEETGVCFDLAAAQALLQTLETDSAIYADLLQEQFPPVTVEETFLPKRDNKTRGYMAGVPFIKRKQVCFNPNSSAQIVQRLKEKYNWEPTLFTDAGEASVKATVLATLDYPEAVTLCRHKTIAKRIAMMTGEKGWLNSVGADGRLHTRYFPHGTVTGRATHRPNISQVPKVILHNKQILYGAGGNYGYECRSLFRPRPGWWLVGADMAGLELRCLAHHLAFWDGGAYAKAVTCGDPHLLTQEATGLTSRDKAKTLVYAVLYGCGDLKAGTIVEPDESDEFVVREIGHLTKKALTSGIPGFAELFGWIDAALTDSYLPGLDGRWLYVRKRFAALNTLLQSTGAILCKRWLLLTEAALQAAGLVHGVDYETNWWSHDEQGWSARTPAIAELISDVAVTQAVKAGEYYHLNCPTAGTAKIGRSWAEVH